MGRYLVIEDIIIKDVVGVFMLHADRFRLMLQTPGSPEIKFLWVCPPMGGREHVKVLADVLPGEPMWAAFRNVVEDAFGRNYGVYEPARYREFDLEIHVRSARDILPQPVTYASSEEGGGAW